MVGARRLPVGPSMAATASGAASPPLNSLRFLPLATNRRLALFNKPAASDAPSFLLAGICSAISICWSAKNLAALVQLVQPGRW